MSCLIFAWRGSCCLACDTLSRYAVVRDMSSFMTSLLCWAALPWDMPLRLSAVMSAEWLVDLRAYFLTPGMSWTFMPLHFLHQRSGRR